AGSKVNDEKIKPIAVIAGVCGTSVFFTDTDGKLRQWDAATRRTRQKFELPTSANGQRAGASGVSVSPDGKQFVVLSNAMVMRGQFATFNGSHISLYDAETGALRRHWLTTEATLSRAAWSGDGRYLLIGGLGMPSVPIQDRMDDLLPISAKTGLL